MAFITITDTQGVRRITEIPDDMPVITHKWLSKHDYHSIASIQLPENMAIEGSPEHILVSYLEDNSRSPALATLSQAPMQHHRSVVRIEPIATWSLVAAIGFFTQRLKARISGLVGSFLLSKLKTRRLKEYQKKILHFKDMGGRKFVIDIPEGLATITKELRDTALQRENLSKEYISYAVIPDGVTHIGNGAFSGCTSLTSIIIPDSVTHIGDLAFIGCNGLASIIIPDSITCIGEYIFSGCTNLTSIIIPDGVTHIGAYTFSGCTSLTSIIIPDSVTHIGNGAFSGCTSLTSIIIPDSVTYIGHRAFIGCNGLASIIIPDSVTYIDKYTFSGCTSLTSIIIPDSVTYIDKYTFSGCTSLTSIIIPDGVTHIGAYTFSGCTSLTSIIIGNSVPHISIYAFSNRSKFQLSISHINLKFFFVPKTINFNDINIPETAYIIKYDPEIKKKPLVERLTLVKNWYLETIKKYNIKAPVEVRNLQISVRLAFFDEKKDLTPALEVFPLFAVLNAHNEKIKGIVPALLKRISDHMKHQYDCLFSSERNPKKGAATDDDQENKDLKNLASELRPGIKDPIITCVPQFLSGHSFLLLTSLKEPVSIFSPAKEGTSGSGSKP